MGHIGWDESYIAAGCINIPASAHNLTTACTDVFSGLQGWNFFGRASSPDTSESAVLPKAAQHALLALPMLKHAKVLWNRKWIEMSFLHDAASPYVGRLRIYILPHDVQRSGTVGTFQDFNDARGLKDVAHLISQLDFSRASWEGETNSSPQVHPTPTDPRLAHLGDSCSLLSLFNDVPSPKPDPENVTDPALRETMRLLLNSKIPGLKSELYPYQRESTALMLQKEAEPERYIDPRLRSVIDQTGKPWYFDSDTGRVHREPRYYDGLQGGILAEEMGTGKTLICLALVLSTRHEPTKPPEPFLAETAQRKRKPSLLDMAAATANRNSVPWKPYFEACQAQWNFEYTNCIAALDSPANRALYRINKNVLYEPRRSGRNVSQNQALSLPIFLSSTTLVVVPNNLVKQWQNEIKKHTANLEVLVLIEKQPIPPITVLLGYDLILFSHTRFEYIQRERSHADYSAADIPCPLEYMRFQRIIFDEGHKLGNGSAGWKTDMMRVIEGLHTAARWVVTGTPSKGLYGVDQKESVGEDGDHLAVQKKQNLESTSNQEREDIQRIGNLAAKFLRARPWSNAKDEFGDSMADWNKYVMSQKQHHRGQNRKDCLKTTLDSLIVRHRLPDIVKLLPPVDERVVYIDGSYQDRLSLNLFSMMIIFNAVQSQRTDMDYFFHPRQKKSLVQLVSNMRQASFFGGAFFSPQDITRALETAEKFLTEKKVPISAEDDVLLKEAMKLGKLALENELHTVSNKFHALPLYLEHFPGHSGKGWSLDDHDDIGEPVCSEAGLISSLQQFLSPCMDAPTSLQLMIDSGRLYRQGVSEKLQALKAVVGDNPDGQEQADARVDALAGHTPLGDDRHSKPKSGSLAKSAPILIEETAEESAAAAKAASSIEIAEPLARTQIISTVSAKLSYLVDAIVKYQDEEQIIVFYDNDNIAYYLAGVLEILQIKHLIYSRVGLSAERRAQYVATFTHSQVFRVLLMDISQAAFGLDMRSASRIYFISPVLNPQVEAQAVGRARRISQQKPVTVETLVLRDSIEEVLIDRRRHMTQAEHRKVNSILDDRPMYEWLLNARILPMPEMSDARGVAETALLQTPQFVFGRGFGRQLHPDEGLTWGSPESKASAARAAQAAYDEKGQSRVTGNLRVPFALRCGQKRPSSPSPSLPPESHREGDDGPQVASNGGGDSPPGPPPKRRARITFAVE